MYEQETAQLQERIEAIKKQYQPRIEALQRQGEELEDGFDKPSTGGAVLGVDFKVDWKQTDIIISIPSVSVRAQKFILSLPEITSKAQKISFDVPEVVMVPHVIGKKPEFHGFTIKWTDIIVSYPETRMRRQDFITDIPQVTMRTKEVIVGIPEFEMVTQRISLNLPQFTIVNVSASIKEVEDEGKALQAEGQEIGKSMQAEISLEVAKFDKLVREGLYTAKNEVGREFDSSLQKIYNAITDVQAKQCDPIKVPTESGDVNLRKMYQDLINEKAKVDSTFSSAIAA